jgi:predicted negative regulator of RcsB-dependent stress response
MKKAIKKPKEKTIIGSVPKRRHLLLIGVVVGVCILIAAGIFGWHYMHRVKPLTKEQQTIQSSIPDQQKAIEEEKNSSAYIKTTTYINLSESYAGVGQCVEARDALSSAKKIAPAQSQKRLIEAQDIINSNC